MGTTLAGGAVVGSTTSVMTGCDLYFEPGHHMGSSHGIIDAGYPMIDASIIDGWTIIDAWNSIADAPNDAGAAGSGVVL
jgi:hypothetical protein